MRRQDDCRFFVYILANKSKVLYTGITNNLERRMQEHRSYLIAGFTAKYQIRKLVYFEEFDSADFAIAREKQIKGWLRERKVRLITSANPDWADLSPEAEHD